MGGSVVIRKNLNLQAVVDEDFMHILDESMDVGMRENGSLYNYKRGSSPCILSAPKHKLNLLFRYLFHLISLLPFNLISCGNWDCYCNSDVYIYQ